MEGVIVTEVAFVVAHVKVTVPPEFTLVESTVKVIVGAAGGCVLWLLPPQEGRSSKIVNSWTKRKACAVRRRDTGYSYQGAIPELRIQQH